MKTQAKPLPSKSMVRFFAAVINYKKLSHCSAYNESVWNSCYFREAEVHLKEMQDDVLQHITKDQKLNRKAFEKEFKILAKAYGERQELSELI